ncbi:hypothetical protein V6N12_030362 [Hibiscus sabdariffa]|uniref:Cationic amino acid transporter C-terminal domain-containing protein n=1 Tax=Hibiscus sabdariffa TaxID=183260 RepID=A0ABR2C0N3_9ROSI
MSNSRAQRIQIWRWWVALLMTGFLDRLGWLPGVVGVYPYCVVRAEPCSLVGAYSSLVTVPIWFLPTLGLKVVKEEKKSKLWGVPLMPWIPSTSIAINVLIVASIDGASFIRFGIFYYVFIALHASYDAAKDTTDTTSAATVTNLEIGVASQIHR